MPQDLYELSDVESGLLKQGIIHIFGPIDEDTYDYVSVCLAIMEATGSPPITVKINSPGGAMDCSLMIHDLISFYAGPSVGLIIGRSCSGGNLILQACTKRYSSANSFHLVHDLSAICKFKTIRNKERWKEEFERSEAIQNQVYAIYQHRTGLSKKALIQLFEKDIFLTPKEALRHKIIDRIVKSIRTKNGVTIVV